MSKIGLFWITYLAGIVTLIAASVKFNFWRWLIVLVVAAFFIMLVQLHETDTYCTKHQK